MRVAIASIVVEPDRFRGATGDMEGLKASLLKFGQLTPIILDGSVLIAGFRRYTAAKAAGWQEIDAIQRDGMTALEKKEVELEENIQRQEMSWQERAKAMVQLDELKKRMDPNWTLSQTAEVAGTEKSHVSEAAKIVKMMELFPEIGDAKTLNQALSWAKAKASGVVRVKEVRDNPAEFQEIEKKLWLGDSVEAIKRISPGSFRAIITDPPFGINYDSRKAGTEQSITAYKDDEESYARILSMAEDFFRVLKDDGWLTFFLGPTHYERAKLAFRGVGFTVDEMPVVWDRSDGRCFTTRPDRYYARGYDLALHCLKGNPEMTAYGRGKSNVLRFPPLANNERELLVERPIELYQELVKRLTVEGETVADFFVGSGSVLAAAASLKRDYFGIELDPARRAAAIKKVRANAADVE